MDRQPLTIDELIERLEEMKKYEGGKCPVFVGISDFEDRPITHIAIDHFTIVLNG